MTRGVLDNLGKMWTEGDTLREALRQIQGVKDVGIDYCGESGDWINDAAHERDCMYEIANKAIGRSDVGERAYRQAECFHAWETCDSGGEPMEHCPRCGKFQFPRANLRRKRSRIKRDMRRSFARGWKCLMELAGSYL